MNLPRRAAPSTRLPVSNPARSPRTLSWRVMARSSNTSTEETIAPLTTGSSPARTTSTSGSSGTALAFGGRRPGLQCCSHLGVLLAGSLAGRANEAVDRDGGVEGLVVVGAGVGHHILRRRGGVPGREFLQARLRVHRGTEAVRILEQRLDEAKHK